MSTHRDDFDNSQLTQAIRQYNAYPTPATLTAIQNMITTLEDRLVTQKTFLQDCVDARDFLYKQLARKNDMASLTQQLAQANIDEGGYVEPLEDQLDMEDEDDTEDEDRMAEINADIARAETVIAATEAAITQAATAT